VRALLWCLIVRSAWARPAPVVVARHVRALLWRLLARSAWLDAATVVAGMSGEGAALASVSLFGDGTASNCGGGYDK
jgi:hypothetical protein